MLIQVKVNIKVPRVPNFLFLDDGRKMPLSSFDEQTLRQIGEQWACDLINRATEMGLKPGTHNRSADSPVVKE